MCYSMYLKRFQKFQKNCVIHPVSTVAHHRNILTNMLNIFTEMDTSNQLQNGFVNMNINTSSVFWSIRGHILVRKITLILTEKKM